MAQKGDAARIDGSRGPPNHRAAELQSYSTADLQNYGAAVPQSHGTTTPRHSGSEDSGPKNNGQAEREQPHDGTPRHA